MSRDEQAAARVRWRGWRTELVGLRACFWLGLAATLEWIERGLHQLVGRTTRRYTVRAHEYDVRCREGASNG